jgi:phosphate acetyltransferase
MNFIEEIRNKVKSLPVKKIVFPEGNESRILKAANFLSREKIVDAIVLGQKLLIEKTAGENDVDLKHLTIVDPAEQENADDTDQLYQLRKHKGIDKKQAAELLKNPLFFGAMMVRNSKAAGAVAGSVNTTGNVLRAAIQVIGLAEGINAVSSCFLMVLQSGRVITFGDCAVIPDPAIEQLASIAISSALTHSKIVGEKPKIAMLSFSTKGSAEHDVVTKVTGATKLVQKLNPSLEIDGELQFDAAFDIKVGASKAPGSRVAGQANVYIFPDLNSGNIGYKIAQRIGNAQAIGPVIQGLAKPYNDLSRGCSVEDIINTACICSLLS